MGSASSKFKKYLQHGDEFAAMQVRVRLYIYHVYCIGNCSKPLHVFGIILQYEENIKLVEEILEMRHYLSWNQFHDWFTRRVGWLLLMSQGSTLRI